MTERIVAAVEGREVDRPRGDYLGKVVCFFEIGDGKIVFNKTYRHTVPKGRV